MLTGISTLAIGDVNSLSQQYIPPQGFSWSDLYQLIPDDLIITDATPPPPVQSWYWSIMNMALFLILGWYLDSVLPDEFGVRQHPLFLFRPTYWGFNRKKTTEKPDLQAWLTSVSDHHAAISSPSSSKRNLFSRLFHRRAPTPDLTPTSSFEEKANEETEVTSLRTAAHDLTVPAALRVVHLRKSFSHKVIAVSDSNFVMHQGELLAVLGANGSGKSTTCHVLCGITPGSAGDALVDDEISLLRSSGLVGWCPQHDILFDELTPLEHVFLSLSMLNVGFPLRCDKRGT
jgi:ABC-type multidrug transport system fused ATPase/permease subunit